MNSNPTKVNQDTVNGNTYKVTTQTLGIANERVRDLTGYVLNPQELSTAVVKYLMCCNIDESDIYSVKVGTTKENQLKIIAEVKAKALQGKKENTSWIDFDEYTPSEGLQIESYFYNVWKNKLYHGKRKNLHLKQIRRYSSGDDKKYIAIDIDPEIFIAFVYDINFCDPFYKVSAPATRWKSNKQLDEVSGKERKRYKSMQQEYSNYGITMCKCIVVTHKEKNSYRLNENNYITGFHPNQVDDFYANDN